MFTSFKKQVESIAAVLIPKNCVKLVRLLYLSCLVHLTYTNRTKSMVSLLVHFKYLITIRSQYVKFTVQTCKYLEHTFSIHFHRYGKFDGTFRLPCFNTKLRCEIQSVYVLVFGAYIFHRNGKFVGTFQLPCFNAKLVCENCSASIWCIPLAYIFQRYGKFVGTFQPPCFNTTLLLCEVYSVNVQVFGAYLQHTFSIGMVSLLGPFNHLVSVQSYYYVKFTV